MIIIMTLTNSYLVMMSVPSMLLMEKLFGYIQEHKYIRVYTLCFFLELYRRGNENWDCGRICLKFLKVFFA